MRLPELRHNLRMICDYVKNDLDALAREGASVKEKRSWLTREDQNLRHKVSEEAKSESGFVVTPPKEVIGLLESLPLLVEIARLQRVHLLVDEVSSIAKTLSTSYEPSLEAFMKPFDQLMFEFAEEYKTYALDEVVVGALSPVVSPTSDDADFPPDLLSSLPLQFRRLVASWDPLSSSTDLFSSLRQWKKAFRFSDPNSADNESIEVYGNGNASQARKSLAA
jgi:tuftelin-interacting protein 11